MDSKEHVDIRNDSMLNYQQLFLRNFRFNFEHDKV